MNHAFNKKRELIVNLQRCVLTTLMSLAIAADSHTRVSAAVKDQISVGATTQEWLDSYLDWTHRHPEVMKRKAGSDSPEPLTLEMPYVALFSPDGIPLYYGGGNDENLTFLRDLQVSVPSRTLIKNSNLRPSLEEYIAMLPELRPFRSQIRDGKKSVLFVVTYRDKPFCKRQNDALDLLGKQSRVRIVEVDLHRS